jgi:hypothetical protein
MLMLAGVTLSMGKVLYVFIHLQTVPCPNNAQIQNAAKDIAVFIDIFSIPPPSSEDGDPMSLVSPMG